MLIGLGGGAASSMGTGRTRRISTSIRCSAATPRSSAARRKSSIAAGRWARPIPILSIHDVGAGGLSNALPELVHGAGRGGALRSARDSERRAGHDADADLVQRGAGALRARDRRRIALPRFGRCASASAVPTRWSARRPTTVSLSSTIRCSATGRWTWNSTVLLGKPPKMTRDVRTRITRTAAVRPARASTLSEAALPRAAPAGGGGQDVSDQHRRSHRGRH